MATTPRVSRTKVTDDTEPVTDPLTTDPVNPDEPTVVVEDPNVRENTELTEEDGEPEVTEDSSPEEKYGEAPEGWQRDDDGGITAVDVPWKGYV